MATSPKFTAMAADFDSSQTLSAFLAMPTPRRIPPTLSLRKDPGAKTLWFVSSLFVVMGALLCWVFLPVHLPKQWTLDRGPTLSATGQVLSREATNLSINKTKVYQYRYRFSAENGAGHEGEAFTTGSKWNQGAKIEVRYLQADPSVSVPVGARMGQGDSIGVLVLFFPLVGCLLLAHTVRTHFGRKALLENGRLGTGTIAALKATWTKVDHQQQYKLTVTRDDGATLVRRTHDPLEIAYAEEKLREGQSVPLLYDPKKPKSWLFPEVWQVSAPQSHRPA